MSKSKETRREPDTEWEVCLLPAAVGTNTGDHLTVTAATVSYDKDWVTLRDTAGRVVFSSGSVRYVRRAPSAEPVLADGGMSMEQIEDAIGAGTLTAHGGAVPPEADG